MIPQLQPSVASNDRSNLGCRSHAANKSSPPLSMSERAWRISSTLRTSVAKSSGYWLAVGPSTRVLASACCQVLSSPVGSVIPHRLCTFFHLTKVGFHVALSSGSSCYADFQTPLPCSFMRAHLHSIPRHVHPETNPRLQASPRKM